MPLPKPKNTEVEGQWNNRCMDDPTMKKEYSSVEQRFAVCQSLWKKSKMETIRDLKTQ